MNYDLALFKWGCTVLLDIDSTYGLNDPLKASWKNVVKNIVPFQIDPKEGLMIGNNVKLTESHRHFSHMLAVFPLQLIDPVKDKELITKSLNHWLTVDNKKGLAAWSYLVASCMYSQLGMGDSALVHIQRAMPSFSASTLYREAGMCMETPLMGVEAINSMLIQSTSKEITIFPAVPTLWKNVSFENLLAYGGFEVSATRKNGETVYLKIKSKTGGKATLITGFSNQKLRIKSSESKDLLETKSPEKIEIELKPNEEIEIKAQRNMPSLNAISDQRRNVFGKKKN